MNYITPQDTKINLNDFNSEFLKECYLISKEIFKNKKQISMFDHMIYNTIRNKPLFRGIEKIKERNYYYSEYLPNWHTTPESMIRYFSYSSNVVREIQSSNTDKTEFIKLITLILNTISVEISSLKS